MCPMNVFGSIVGRVIGRGGGKGRGGKVRKKKIDIGRFYLYIIENGYIHISHTYI